MCALNSRKKSESTHCLQPAIEKGLKSLYAFFETHFILRNRWTRGEKLVFFELKTFWDSLFSCSLLHGFVRRLLTGFWDYETEHNLVATLSLEKRTRRSSHHQIKYYFIWWRAKPDKTNGNYLLVPKNFCCFYPLLLVFSRGWAVFVLPKNARLIC